VSQHMHTWHCEPPFTWMMLPSSSVSLDSFFV
jgi:hypothetical protein